MPTDTAYRNLKPKAKPYKKCEGGGLYMLGQSAYPSLAEAPKTEFPQGHQFKATSSGRPPGFTIADLTRPIWPDLLINPCGAALLYLGL